MPSGNIIESDLLRLKERLQNLFEIDTDSFALVHPLGMSSLDNASDNPFLENASVRDKLNGIEPQINLIANMTKDLHLELRYFQFGRGGYPTYAKHTQMSRRDYYKYLVECAKVYRAVDPLRLLSIGIGPLDDGELEDIRAAGMYEAFDMVSLDLGTMAEEVREPWKVEPAKEYEKALQHQILLAAQTGLPVNVTGIIPNSPPEHQDSIIKRYTSVVARMMMGGRESPERKVAIGVGFGYVSPKSFKDENHTASKGKPLFIQFKRDPVSGMYVANQSHVWAAFDGVQSRNKQVQSLVDRDPHDRDFIRPLTVPLLASDDGQADDGDAGVGAIPASKPQPADSSSPEAIQRAFEAANAGKVHTPGVGANGKPFNRCIFRFYDGGEPLLLHIDVGTIRIRFAKMSPGQNVIVEFGVPDTTKVETFTLNENREVVVDMSDPEREKLRKLRGILLLTGTHPFGKGSVPLVDFSAEIIYEPPAAMVATGTVRQGSLEAPAEQEIIQEIPYVPQVGRLISRQFLAGGQRP